MANRLTALIPDTDTVARFGGDEFVIMVLNLDADLQQAISRIQVFTTQIVNELNRSYSFTGFEHRITVSVGITLFSDSSRGAIDQLLQKADLAIEKMWLFQNLGIGFSLGDFGSGYSSLSYLKKLPLKYLKIDKSFVQDLRSSASDEAIAKTIVGLSQSLGIDVIAEGVETEAQLELLVSYGCHIYQGYQFSKPVPLEEIKFSSTEVAAQLIRAG